MAIPTPCPAFCVNHDEQAYALYLEFCRRVALNGSEQRSNGKLCTDVQLFAAYSKREHLALRSAGPATLGTYEQTVWGSVEALMKRDPFIVPMTAKNVVSPSRDEDAFPKPDFQQNISRKAIATCERAIVPIGDWRRFVEKLDKFKSSCPYPKVSREAIMWEGRKQTKRFSERFGIDRVWYDHTGIQWFSTLADINPNKRSRWKLSGNRWRRRYYEIRRREALPFIHKDAERVFKAGTKMPCLHKDEVKRVIRQTELSTRDWGVQLHRGKEFSHWKMETLHEQVLVPANLHVVRLDYRLSRFPTFVRAIHWADRVICTKRKNERLIVGLPLMSMVLAAVQDEESSLKLHLSSGLGSVKVSQYRPQITDANRPRHKFFSSLAPACPITKGGVYLTLKKSVRNDPAPPQLYIGRVIQRDRHKGETTREWTALSMTQAEAFVVKQLRSAESREKWLKWTECYYALKGNVLPLVPDGLEESAWEIDADGKYVRQSIGEVTDEGSTLVTAKEDWDAMESWMPPGLR